MLIMQRILLNLIFTTLLTKHWAKMALKAIIVQTKDRLKNSKIEVLILYSQVKQAEYFLLHRGILMIE